MAAYSLPSPNGEDMKRTKKVIQAEIDSLMDKRKGYYHQIDNISKRLVELQWEMWRVNQKGTNEQ